MLTVTANKLIDLVCKQLVHSAKEGEYANTLIITGQDPVPLQIQNGILSAQNELCNSHEEADVMIVHQMLYASKQRGDVSIVCDDADVFLLLLRHYHKHKLNNVVMMEATSAGRTAIDIGATVAQHNRLIDNLLAAHALTGSDTTASLHGIGKVTTVKVLQQSYTLTNIGHPESNEADRVREATQFIAKCYGMTVLPTEIMSDVRFASWLKKNAKRGISSAPPLKSLPPTTEAFCEHVKRCHFQTSIWKSADQPNPPHLIATHYGWEKEVVTKSLLPVALPAMTLCAPNEILMMIKCNCAAENRCKTGHCGCKSAGIACTLFCSCQ